MPYQTKKKITTADLPASAPRQVVRMANRENLTCSPKI